MVYKITLQVGNIVGKPAVFTITEAPKIIQKPKNGKVF